MNKLTYRACTTIPPVLEPGVLYVSALYHTASHLCPCGCGNEIVTPLGTGGWSFYLSNGAPSLRPSVSSPSLPCKSHYHVTDGFVEWLNQRRLP